MQAQQVHQGIYGRLSNGLLLHQRPRRSGCRLGFTSYSPPGARVVRFHALYP